MSVLCVGRKRVVWAQRPSSFILRGKRQEEKQRKKRSFALGSDHPSWACGTSGDGEIQPVCSAGASALCCGLDQWPRVLYCIIGLTKSLAEIRGWLHGCPLQLPLKLLNYPGEDLQASSMGFRREMHTSSCLWACPPGSLKWLFSYLQWSPLLLSHSALVSKHFSWGMTSHCSDKGPFRGQRCN